MASSKLSKETQLFHSLVKYDTPYLVSTTVNNKKAIQELSQDSEKTNSILRSVFYKNKSTSSSNDETEDFSLKDALNKILPPKKIIMNGQLWVQYVSCTPVTKMEVVTLKNGLEKRLKTLNAKETGICPIREELYEECFDELIRQVTINCLERGILMMLIKQESMMTMKAYQELYQSSIAYGIRNGLIAEEEKKKLREKIEDIDEKNEKITEDIEKLEKIAEVCQNASYSRNSQVTIIVCGNKVISDKFWEQDCCAVTENILLASEALGVGAVWCAVYPFGEKIAAIKNLFNLPEEIVPLNIIPMGYPLTNEEPKQKYNPEKIHNNNW